jgi:hypothetical protein
MLLDIIWKSRYELKFRSSVFFAIGNHTATQSQLLAPSWMLITVIKIQTSRETKRNASISYSARVSTFSGPETLWNVSQNQMLYVLLYKWGTRWRGWLRHCATGRRDAGSTPDGVTGTFHWHNSSGRIKALRLTQPPTEMSIRNISWG